MTELLRTPRVAVIGAGVGGLCAAIALRRRGIEAVVYERAEMLGDVGAGLLVWANAVRVLKELGVADAVLRDGSVVQHGQVRTSDGRVLAVSAPGELEKTFGLPSVAIHRAALHRALMEALPADAVQLGAACESVCQDDNGATAVFADGRRVRADVVVGADGIRSVVRRHFFPDATPRYAGYVAWRGAVATRDEVALGLTSESWGRGNRFGILRLDADRVYWFATANREAGRKRTPSEHREDLLGIFGGWHHPVRHLLEGTAPEAILYNDLCDLAPMQRWSAGRITLLGDAAHATTPNMGQGACMAIESAYVLAESLAKRRDLPGALLDYENARRARTAWVTNQSWRIGRMAQWENPAACALRNLVTKSVSGFLMKNQLARAVGAGPV